MAMIRARDRVDSDAPMRLVYSVRSPDEVLYAAELSDRRAAGLPVDLVYTRRAPAGQPIGRLDARAVRAAAPVGQLPLLYVCGPTGFVEAVASALVDAGHQEALIRTERFGPSGG
jgi:ferredoxin-NADP reductase